MQVHPVRCTTGAPITVLHHPHQGRQPWLPSDPFRRRTDRRIFSDQKSTSNHPTPASLTPIKSGSVDAIRL
ncbi:hypothetical protein ACLOJK_026868, partial [Asimina triloba]